MWYFARSTLQRCSRNVLKISQRNFRGKNVKSPFFNRSSDGTEWQQLIKPTIFTIGFGTVMFTGCFIYKYEKKRAQKLKQYENNQTLLRDFFSAEIKRPKVILKNFYRSLDKTLNKTSFFNIQSEQV